MHVFISIFILTCLMLPAGIALIGEDTRGFSWIRKTLAVIAGWAFFFLIALFVFLGAIT